MTYQEGQFFPGDAGDVDRKSTLRIETARALLELGERIDPRELFPVLLPAAGELVMSDPYAFALAISLDRGTLAEVIWTLPYYIKAELGHLDPWKVDQASPAELAEVLARLPQRPRYIEAAPRTIKDLTRIVVREFGGDASRICKGKTANEVKRTFGRIYGVGPGIASMAVLLIEKAYGLRFSDLDRATMDVKPDVHVTRVLYRLGMAPAQSELAALQAARQMHPPYPGQLDAPLWWIGRRYCFAVNPQCDPCPMDAVCPKVGTAQLWQRVEARKMDLILIACSGSKAKDGGSPTYAPSTALAEALQPATLERLMTARRGTRHTRRLPTRARSWVQGVHGAD